MAVVILGAWVLILPHLGFPGTWRTVILTITGLIIVGVGLYLRGVMLSKGIRRSSHHPFVENSASHDIRTPQNHEHSQEAR
jgi:hypothetical protein